jgi:hypothetical protein
MRNLLARSRSASPLIAIGFSALMLLPAARTPAATFLANWQGPNNGTWSTPANWDINQVPNNTATNTYNVGINAGANSVKIDINPTINDYTQTTGSIAGIPNVNAIYVNGNMTWNSGTINNISFNAKGPVTISKTVAANPNPTLGNAFFTTSGTTMISATPLDGLTGAVFVNTAPGTLNISLTTQFNDLSGGVAPLPLLSNYGARRA